MSIYGDRAYAAFFKGYNCCQSVAVAFAEEMGMTEKQAEGSPVASPRTPEYYKKRPCPELCRVAADIMAEYIAAHPRD